MENNPLNPNDEHTNDETVVVPAAHTETHVAHTHHDHGHNHHHDHSAVHGHQSGDHDTVENVGKFGAVAAVGLSLLAFVLQLADSDFDAVKLVLAVAIFIGAVSYLVSMFAGSGHAHTGHHHGKSRHGAGLATMFAILMGILIVALQMLELFHVVHR